MNEDALRSEVEALKAENAKLREFNAQLQAQRKEFLDYQFGPPDASVPTEDEVAEAMQNLIPFEQILAAGLEEYLHPAGVAVIEWAERWFGQAANAQHRPVHYRAVQIETVSETVRRITYDDPGT